MAATRVGTTQSGGGGTTSSRSWNHTLVGSANRVLTIWLFFGDSRSTVSAITVDGVDVSGYFVRSALATGTAHGVLCYVVPGLAAGSRSIAVTYAAGCENWYASDEAEDVDQSSPVRDHDGAVGASTGGTFGPTLDSADADLVYRAAVIDSNSWTANAPSPLADLYNDSSSDGKVLSHRAGDDAGVAAQATFAVGAFSDYAIVGISLQSPGGGSVLDAAVTFAGAGTVTPAAMVRRAAGAAFAGAATLTGAPVATRNAAAGFSGVATMAAAPNVLRVAGAAFAGVATFSAQVAGGVLNAAAAFTGSGTLSAAAQRVRNAGASFAGAGAFTAAANRRLGAVAAFAGTATLSPAAITIRNAAALFAGIATFTATAEADAEGYQGKYAAEQAEALASIQAARGFASDHASARADIAGAGR